MPTHTLNEQAQSEGGIYSACDFAFIRAPALAIETFAEANLLVRRAISLAEFGSGDVPGRHDALARRVLDAIAIASPSLLAAMTRFGSLSNAGSRRVLSRVFRYVSRMAARATPFGAFAGTALIKLGVATDLRFSTNPCRLISRPDMNWLETLRRNLEHRDEIFQQLSVLVNPDLILLGGRAFVTSVTDSGSESEHSIRVTPVVLDLLGLAQEPIRYSGLVRALLDADSSRTRTREKVSGLIEQLFRVGMLVSDLRIALTVHSPARLLANRLQMIPASRTEGRTLENIVERCDRWNGSNEEYERISESARSLWKVDGPALQVDTNLNLDRASVHQNVGARAAEAAHLLLSLSPFPRGLPLVQRYKNAFLAKYGERRRVPLLDLVDVRRGLGPLSSYAAAAPDDRQERRNSVLLELLANALNERQSCIQLNDDTLSRLQTPIALDDYPMSIDIAFFLGATNSAEIDCGNFDLVISPFVGSRSAGRTLGRFANNLGVEAVAALRAIALREQDCAKECQWAELVSFPSRGRLGNLLIRPGIREFEIVDGSAAGVDPSKMISLADIEVSLLNGRFHLKARQSDKRLIVSHSNMLNPTRLSPASQMLVELNDDGIAAFSGFDWGSLKGSPFLPRVRRKRIVLTPAQWRITSENVPGDLQAPSESARYSVIQKWRSQWSVPRFVYMTAGDNRVLLDLEEREQCSELVWNIQATKHGPVVLQEMLPAFAELVGAESSEGRHLAEIVVPLVRRDTSGSISRTSRLRFDQGCPDLPHTMFPGTDWLFLKIYCPNAAHSLLVENAMATYVAEVMDQRLAVSWFFIPYADPEPHIRLRFRGDAALLTQKLLPRCLAWAESLKREDLCMRFAIDTYEREVERYGGARMLSLFEDMFCTDSASVVRLLQMVREFKLEADMVAIAAFSIEELLRGLGLATERRLRWYSSRPMPNRLAGPEFRKYKGLVPFMTGHAGSYDPWVIRLREVLAVRAKELRPYAERLRSLYSDDEEDILLPDSVISSIVHMHCNRLMGTSRHLESKSIELASRLSRAVERIRAAQL